MLAELRLPDNGKVFGFVFFLNGLLVLLEVILLAEVQLGIFVLMGKVSFETRAEVNVPAPESAEDALRILVVMSAELAGLAGELLCHNVVY